MARHKRTSLATPRIELEWGTLPGIASFERHVRGSVDDMGAPILRDKAPVLTIEIRSKYVAEVAESAAYEMEAEGHQPPRVLEVPYAAAELEFDNVRQIHKYLQYLVYEAKQGQSLAGPLGRAIMWALNYDWQWPGVSRIAESCGEELSADLTREEIGILTLLYLEGSMSEADYRNVKSERRYHKAFQRLFRDGLVRWDCSVLDDHRMRITAKGQRAAREHNLVR